MLKKIIKKLLAPIVREIIAETIQDALKVATLAVDKFEIVSSEQKSDFDS